MALHHPTTQTHRQVPLRYPGQALGVVDNRCPALTRRDNHCRQDPVSLKPLHYLQRRDKRSLAYSTAYWAPAQKVVSDSDTEVVDHKSDQ